MAFPRRGLLPFRAFRNFSTTSKNLQLPLAHQAWSAPTPSQTESSGRPIIFMHGLFGSKQNNGSIMLAKELNTTIFAIDLRNHGDSPHDQQHDYNSMADDVVGFMKLSNLQKPVLIGHSMGAKTAMAIALRSPSMVSAVISVDNAPVNVPLSTNFEKYVQGMKQIEDANVTKQKEADEILQPFEESLPIRQFLLTNLVRSKDDGTLKSRIPLQIIGQSLDNMADFPYRISDDVSFEGPALFIKGTRSGYIREKSMQPIKKFFPAWQLEEVEAGHWLISENPEAFKNVVVNFLKGVN